jgi:peptidoglycan/LPS O-acetylase OafA/YrhL
MLAEWLGSWGVCIFFVLSGFCIHLPQARHMRSDSNFRVDWPEFYRRRARRLLPPHYAALVIAIAVGSRMQTALIGRPTSANVVAHVLMIHPLVSAAMFSSINGVFWSVAIEVHFYIVYPLYLILRKYLGSGLVPIVLVAMGLTIYGAGRTLLHGDAQFVVMHCFLVSWWQWGLGVLLADIYVSGSSRLARAFLFRRSAILWLALSLLPAWWDPTFLGLHLRYWALPFLCFGLLGAACTADHSWLKGRALPFLGTASYSIYLMHPIGLALAIFLLDRSPTSSILGRLVLDLTASILVSLAFFFAVERFFLSKRSALHLAQDGEVQSLDR